jgi:hypothetical protein
MIEEMHDRLAHIETIAEDRPGEALDELQAVIADLTEALADRQAKAHALCRNDDLAGAARHLNESALLLHRTATLALVIREEVRRRR